MSSIKTTVSLDASLLEQIDAVAKELRISRSRLLARAAKEFLLRRPNAKLGAFNEAHAGARSEEEIERRRVWKRYHRRRIERSTMNFVPENPPEMSPEGKARVDAMTEEQIHAAALTDPDAQPLTEEQLARMQRAIDPKASGRSSTSVGRNLPRRFTFP